MPKLSVWMIRTALLHMGAGFLFGALILHHKGAPIYPWTWKLLEPHIELVIFGWTMQLVMGVAFYSLPRFSHQAERYGPVYLGWWSFGLLNGGVIVTLLAHIGDSARYALSGRLSILLAVLVYIRVIWPRVKPLTVDKGSTH